MVTCNSSEWCRVPLEVLRRSSMAHQRRTETLAVVAQSSVSCSRSAVNAARSARASLRSIAAFSRNCRASVSAISPVRSVAGSRTAHLRVSTETAAPLPACAWERAATMWPFDASRIESVDLCDREALAQSGIHSTCCGAASRLVTLRPIGLYPVGLDEGIGARYEDHHDRCGRTAWDVCASPAVDPGGPAAGRPVGSQSRRPLAGRRPTFCVVRPRISAGPSVPTRAPAFSWVLSAAAGSSSNVAS